MIPFAVQKLLRSSTWSSKRYSPVFVNSVQTTSGYASTGSDLGRKIRGAILDALRRVPGLVVESQLFRGPRPQNIRAKLFSNYQVNPPERTGSIYLELRPSDNPKQVLSSSSPFYFSPSNYSPPPDLPPEVHYPRPSAATNLNVDLKHNQGDMGDFVAGDGFRYYVSVEHSYQHYLALFYRSGNTWLQMTNSFKTGNGLTVWPKPGPTSSRNGIPVEGEHDNDEIWAFACDQRLPALVLEQNQYQGDGFKAIINKMRSLCSRYGYDNAQLTILGQK